MRVKCLAFRIMEAIWTARYERRVEALAHRFDVPGLVGRNLPCAGVPSRTDADVLRSLVFGFAAFADTPPHDVHPTT